VGLTTDLPLADNTSILSPGRIVSITVEGVDLSPGGATQTARLIGIDASYAEAAGISVAGGRTFSTQDTPETSPVAVVNEAFVRRFLGGRDPLGSQVMLQVGAPGAPGAGDSRESRESREIVGVLADVRRNGLESEAAPEIYVALTQLPRNGLVFIVHTSGDPAALSTPVRDALWAVDPNQAIWANRPMSDLLSDARSRQRRFNTVLLSVFGALALCLSAIGVYGLVAFSVEQRRAEMGIRRALGGSTSHILGSVLRHSAYVAAIGIAVGLAGSLALTRFLRGMLFGVEVLDPVTFITLSALVMAASLLAALVPASRATRVDAMEALSGAD